MDDLTLQVGLVHRVELGDAERPHPGGGQVHQGRRAQPAGTDGQHLRVLQPLLAGHRDVRNDQMPGVPADLVDAQVGRGLDQGRQGHDLSSRSQR